MKPEKEESFSKIGRKNNIKTQKKYKKRLVALALVQKYFKIINVEGN